MHPYFVFFLIALVSVASIIAVGSIAAPVHHLQDQIIGFFHWLFHLRMPW